MLNCLSEECLNFEIVVFPVVVVVVVEMVEGIDFALEAASYIA